MAKKIESKELRALIKDIAMSIVYDFKDLSNVCLIGIHTRGVPIAKRIKTSIKRAAKIDLPVGKIDINLYRDDFSLSSESPIVKQTDVPFEVNGKNIILVDDVLFTGRTIRSALDAVMDIGRPERVMLAVLINRPKDREVPICPDYYGMEINLKRIMRVNVMLKEIDGEDKIVIVRK